MKTAYFWLTPQGKQLAEQLQAHFGGTVEPKADFAETVRRAFTDCDALVFVMATGIVVRTIAPLVQSKASDPAVLVLDQRGKHVISLLSGHLGGANAMAEQAAAYLGGEAVITTATDVEHVPAFDLFAKENHLTIENLEELKYISGALVAGEPVSLCTAFPVEKNAFPETVQIQPFSETPPACLCCGNCRYHGICRGTPCALSAAEKSGAGGGVQKADPAGTSGTVLPDVFAGAPPQSFGSGKAGDHWAEAGRAGDSGTV